MSLRSRGRKLSFDVLSATASFDGDEQPFFSRSNSDPPSLINGESSKPKRKRKNRGAKKKAAKTTAFECSIAEASVADNGVDSEFRENGDCASELGSNFRSYSVQSVVCEEVTVVPEEGSVRALPAVVEPEFQKVIGGELRQRSVNGVDGNAKEGCGSERLDFLFEKPRIESIGKVFRSLDTEKSLDWKQLMAEDPNYLLSMEKSPVKYLLEEMYAGNSLRNTTSIGNEKERERDSIDPLEGCEDKFKKPSAAELSDFGCFMVLACGVTLLEQADISLIYHMIRGQGTIKLYVVYNVLEIFDKLCQSFGGDVFQTLFNSAEGLASCSSENMKYWIWRFIADEALAVAASIVHSFILLAQAITLSTCIVAHNNALLALLVSNNFSEIKSNVFKRFSKDNIRNLVYADSVERFHISAFLLFFLAQNILEAEGPWFEGFLFNALLVCTCEMMIDIIKHSFLAKFNDLKPIVYSEFLEDLCKQTLDIEPEAGKKNLTFVPLAPACVVIRVLSPVYAAHLPHSPLPWRLFWTLLLCALTYVMLASLKVMIGMGLKKHATWYVNRCQKRKLHCD